MQALIIGAINRCSLDGGGIDKLDMSEVTNAGAQLEIMHGQHSLGLSSSLAREANLNLRSSVIGLELCLFQLFKG